MYLDFARRTQRYVPRHDPRSIEIPRFATRVYHFTLSGVSQLSLLDPLFIQVLNIVVDLVLLVLLLQAMMGHEERGPIMVVILEMMVGIIQIDNKVNIH